MKKPSTRFGAIAFAALFFSLGSLITLVAITAIFALPGRQEMSQPSGGRIAIPGIPKHGDPFLFRYSLPTEMTVGDVTVVEEHATNEHLEFVDRKGRPNSPVISYSLTADRNCSVRSVMPAGRMAFPKRGDTTAYGWTVHADEAGQCALSFQSSIPELAQFSQTNSFLIPVSERFTRAQETAIVVAIISVIGVLGGALITGRENRKLEAEKSQALRESEREKSIPKIFLK